MSLLLSVTSTVSSDSTNSIIEPTTKQLNALQKWWASIDWEALIALVIQKTIMVIFLIILFLIIWKLSLAILNRAHKSYDRKNSVNASRMNTMFNLIGNIMQYTVGFLFVYSLLSALGVPVGSLLAGAGIIGLAIGLGAQGFMNDIITGFFIIMEQQVSVGDYIKLANLNIEGTVTGVGLRTMKLKAFDGTVHFIPNRNITTVSNASRANMRVLVDVRIDPAEDLEQIRTVIGKVNHEIEMKYEDSITTPPSIFGMVDLGNGMFALRSTLYVKNGFQYQIEEELLNASVSALVKAGFTIPTTPILPTV